METIEIVLIIFWIIFAALFSMAIWGGWTERAFEKEKDSYWPWYWLRLFGVPLTRENCIRFVKVISIFGLALVTFATVLAFFFRN